MAGCQNGEPSVLWKEFSERMAQHCLLLGYSWFWRPMLEQWRRLRRNLTPQRKWMEKPLHIHQLDRLHHGGAARPVHPACPVFPLDPVRPLHPVYPLRPLCPLHPACPVPPHPVHLVQKACPADPRASPLDLPALCRVNLPVPCRSRSPKLHPRQHPYPYHLPPKWQPKWQPKRKPKRRRKRKLKRKPKRKRLRGLARQSKCHLPRRGPKHRCHSPWRLLLRLHRHRWRHTPRARCQQYRCCQQHRCYAPRDQRHRRQRTGRHCCCGRHDHCLRRWFDLQCRGVSRWSGTRPRHCWWKMRHWAPKRLDFAGCQ